MYTSFEAAGKAQRQTGRPFWKLCMEDDCREEGTRAEDSFSKMKSLYLAMKQADKDYDPSLRSGSGLVGGEAQKLEKRRREGSLLCGDFMGRVMERALRTAESNACMKRIVAAPTAGSCGVLPAVLVTIQEEKHYTDDQMTEALYAAAGIGGIIAARASLAGAEGGCQAEIGSASSMAAGALCSLQYEGGEPGDVSVIGNAAALAMKGLLGLVCDPVAGLVEVPCVKRNVIGAVNACSCADMALSGIESRIPPDEVMDAMRSVGRSMSGDLRETGRGGLAAVPSALKIRSALTEPGV